MVPFWATVMYGSSVVLAIAMPVSKPYWFVTNGNSRLQVQAEIENRVEGGVVSGTKRGIGPVVAVGTADRGQKLVATVVGAVGAVVGGVLVAVSDVYSTLIGTFSVSSTLGSA